MTSLNAHQSMTKILTGLSNGDAQAQSRGVAELVDIVRDISHEHHRQAADYLHLILISEEQYPDLYEVAAQEVEVALIKIRNEQGRAGDERDLVTLQEDLERLEIAQDILKMRNDARLSKVQELFELEEEIRYAQADIDQMQQMTENILKELRELQA